MSRVCRRCDARAGASRVGRQEFALSHPRIYPTPASQGAGLWNHPCVRGPLFLVPVFFTDWPPVVQPAVRRSWTEFAWAFVRHRSSPFRSVPTSGRFTSQRGIRPRSSRLLAPAPAPATTARQKMCAIIDHPPRNHAGDIKLLNYTTPPCRHPRPATRRHATRISRSRNLVNFPAVRRGLVRPRY